MATTTITHLAFELLHQIMLFVPHRVPTPHSTTPCSSMGKEWGCLLKEDSDQLHKLAPLRRTCRAFDAAIQPILFSELTIDCLYTRREIIDHQLSCFEANGNGPWSRYTRKLRIVNLDPCYDRKPSGGGVQYWDEYLNQEQRDEAEETRTMVRERLVPSLRVGFPKLESLRWFVRTGDPVESLLAHFSSLPSLQSLELIFWQDAVFPNFPLDVFSNLTEISLFFYHDVDEVRVDDTWVANARQAFLRLHKVIEASPSLNSLKLGRRYRFDASQDSQSLFPSDLLLSPSCRKLGHLALRRFDLVGPFSIPKHFYPQLLRNLNSLTSVDLTECGYNTESVFWKAMLNSDVLLTSIKLDYVTTDFIDYISQPKVPLEHLTLLAGFHLYDELSWEGTRDLVRKTYTTVLEVHSRRLKHLDIQATGQSLWWLECLNPRLPKTLSVSIDRASSAIPAELDPDERFEPRDPSILLGETSLLHCEQLRSLGLVVDFQRAMAANGLSFVPGAIEDRVTALLKHLSTSMPQLDVVTIHVPDRINYASFSQTAGTSIRKVIQDFMVGEKDRKNVRFDIIFEESRYGLRKDIPNDFDPTEDEGVSSRMSWRFIDINAESDMEEDDEEFDDELFNEHVRDELPNVFY